MLRDTQVKGPRGHVLFSKGATCGRPTPSMQFLAFTGFHKASVIIHVSNLTSSGGERISRSLMKGICLGLCARSGSSSMVPQYSLKMRVSFAQSCLTLCDLPMRFSREEYWSGLPCPPPGDLLTQRSNPHLLVSCIGRRSLNHQCHLGSPFV